MPVCVKRKMGEMSKAKIKKCFGVGAIIVMSGLVTACAKQPSSGLNSAALTYQQRHPIIVDTSPTTLDLPAGNEKTHLTAGMKSAIKGFADDYHRSGAKGLQVLVPSGSSNEVYAGHIANHARGLLEKRGVSKNHISVRSYQAQSTEDPGHIRLSFVAVKARVDSECGVWPTDLSSNFNNQNYQNFGCATQSNLAAIVADPNDLITPRGNGEINAERTGAIFDDFQDNTPPIVTPIAVSDAF